MNRNDVIRLLTTQKTGDVEKLYRHAENVTKKVMGNVVHLRGLIEITNHCRRKCRYCGINANNKSLERYRLTADEVIDAANEAYRCGCNTIVIQGGEDPGIDENFISNVIRRIKKTLPVAVTLSLGEHSKKTYAAWKKAGADRYLIRFEIGDRDLYAKLHPDSNGLKNRMQCLHTLKELKYEVGSGVLLGLPGQTVERLADDVMTFLKLDLDMVGVGPFVNHSLTKLTTSNEVEASADTAYRVNSFVRILSPSVNVPSTTATATLDHDGYTKGLQRGANVIMLNFTPMAHRKLYEIYPNKACIYQDRPTRDSITKWLNSIGRVPGTDVGNRRRLN